MNECPIVDSWRSDASEKCLGRRDCLGGGPDSREMYLKFTETWHYCQSVHSSILERRWNFLIKLEEAKSIRITSITEIFPFSRSFRAHHPVGSLRYRFCAKLGNNTCPSICPKTVAGPRSSTWRCPACHVCATKWIYWITARRWVALIDNWTSAEVRKVVSNCGFRPKIERKEANYDTWPVA